jgi:uncharacterized repeat protein (TIGR01451 family)
MNLPDQLCTISRRRRWISPAMLLVVFGAMLWFGGSHALAADLPLDINQTIPSPPTPTPLPPPATPTQRPPTPAPPPTSRPDNGDQGAQDSPALTPVQEGGESVPATAPVNAPSSPITATVAVPALNVRQGPGTTFAVIGRLTGGAQVTVLARNAGSTWLNICCLPETQTAGWISAQFVTPAYTAEQLAVLPVGDGTTLIAGINTTATLTASTAVIGVVSVPSLNARAEPSTDAAVLGRFTSGAQVTVLGRNSAGNWWLVCCLPGGAGNAWVAAGFVSSGATDSTRAALPVITGRDTLNAANTTNATPVATPTPEPAALTEAELVLTGPQSLLAAVQGGQVVFSFTVTNPGTVSATQAEFSFEIPAGLTFVSASATDGGETAQADTASGASLVIVTWVDLPADASATVRITATVDRDLANGTVLDGSAVALAGNAASTFVPVSVGLPPVAPPDFQ